MHLLVFDLMKLVFRDLFACIEVLKLVIVAFEVFHVH